MTDFADPAVMKDLLEHSKTVAVVGCSDDPYRPSFAIAQFLQSKGYRMIPVNPGLEEVLGMRCYPSLKAIPEKVDLVDVFRRSKFVPDVVDDAIAAGAKAIWLQEGVVHEEAAKRARKAGLKVVMDRCTMKEHFKLGL